MSVERPYMAIMKHRKVVGRMVVMATQQHMCGSIVEWVTTATVLAFRRLRQKEPGFEEHLGDIVSPCLNRVISLV